MANDWGYESEHIRGIEFKDAKTRNTFDEVISTIKSRSSLEELNKTVESFYEVLREYNTNNENFKVVDNFEVGISVWDYAEEYK